MGESLSLFVISSINVGNALTMRKILKDALGELMGERMPMLQKSVQLARSQYPENTYHDPAYCPMDTLAEDLGIEVGTADHGLKVCLEMYKKNESDSNLWDLLPLAYAAAFFSKPWETAHYDAHYDVYSNNLQVMPLAMQKLIICFQSIVVTDSMTIGASSSPLELSLRQFIKVGAFILLRMRIYGATPRFRNHPIPAMFLFMEKFVNESEQLDRSMLEEVMPYSLINSACTDIALGKLRQA